MRTKILILLFLAALCFQQAIGFIHARSMENSGANGRQSVDDVNTSAENTAVNDGATGKNDSGKNDSGKNDSGKNDSHHKYSDKNKSDKHDSHHKDSDKNKSDKHDSHKSEDNSNQTNGGIIGVVQNLANELGLSPQQILNVLAQATGGSGLNNAGLNNAGLNPGFTNVGLNNAGLNNAGLNNAGLNPGFTNVGLNNAGLNIPAAADLVSEEGSLAILLGEILECAVVAILKNKAVAFPSQVAQTANKVILEITFPLGLPETSFLPLSAPIARAVK